MLESVGCASSITLLLYEYGRLDASAKRRFSGIQIFATPPHALVHKLSLVSGGGNLPGLHACRNIFSSMGPEHLRCLPQYVPVPANSF